MPSTGTTWRIRALATVGAAALTAGLAAIPTASAHTTIAEPSDGALTLAQPTLAWPGDHFETAAAVFPGASCEVPSMCDDFELTVDVPAEHWKSNTGGAEVAISWEDAEDDFDLHVFDANGDVVGESTSATSNVERVEIPKASGTYRVLVNPYTVTDSDYTGQAGLTSTPKDGTTPAPGGEVPSEGLSNVPCADGLAGPFPCSNVDLAAYMPLSEIGVTDSLLIEGAGNDIWGWTDPETGREYALMGSTKGTSFIDVTEPTAPVYLGMLPTAQPVETIFASWRDIKVYKNHAFVVSEEPLHGMQVFDLTRLRGVTGEQTWTEDAHYPNFTSAHNIAINEDSGFAYAIGTQTCDGGPHVIDISTPKSPTEAGCVDEDGYTHDTQAVIYNGPDPDYIGHEILFNSNEDTVTIVDVTDKANPVQLSRTGYENASYTHQGWLTEDSRYFLFDDELDEQEVGVNTTTYILDVSDLDNPTMKGQYVAQVPAIDHNLYTKDGKVYEANYRSGLRILSSAEVSQGKLSEIGFFDVYPADDEAEFNGSWSNYPYFDSGTVVVSGIEQGLFVLKPTV